MNTTFRQTHAKRSSPAAARAYALPLVILVSLGASLAIGIVLSRHADSHLAVNRQVVLYRDHHRQMGMQELVDRWIVNVVTRGSVRDQLGDGGLAFELTLPQGTTARVYFDDAQGAALEDLRVLHGPEAAYARRLLRALDQMPQPAIGEGRERVFREFGPAKLSVHTVDLAVLEALAGVIVPSSDSRKFVRTLIDRRARADLAPNDIRAIAMEAGLNSDETAAAEMMLTAQPTLWRVTAEISGGGVQQRAQGLVEVPAIMESSSAGRFAKFLSWKEQ
ncbi:MAG: hypothetical protein H7210_02105 [Pyrinomonadaceae bacterium]|nr:hypothetical protein [Phycisphaerales bacterium]